MRKEAEDEITLRIHCHELPGMAWGGRSGVRLGIQKGRDVVDDVPADAAEVTFTVPLRVKISPHSDAPDFSGPFVQGAKGDRFIYLNWGERLAGADEWEGFSRAKLLLTDLSRARIANALQSGRPLKVSVRMTDARGRLVCASLRGDEVQWTP